MINRLHTMIIHSISSVSRRLTNRKEISRYRRFIQQQFFHRTYSSKSSFYSFETNKRCNRGKMSCSLPLLQRNCSRSHEIRPTDSRSVTHLILCCVWAYFEHWCLPGWRQARVKQVGGTLQRQHALQKDGAETSRLIAVTGSKLLSHKYTTRCHVITKITHNRLQLQHRVAVLIVNF